MPNSYTLISQKLIAKIADMDANGSTLVEVLAVCSQTGHGPQNMAAWIACLSTVYQARSTPPTATEYADAIYTVWAPDWATMDGTAAIAAGSTTLTGTGTSFATLQCGSGVQLTEGTTITVFTVADTPSSDTELTVGAAPTAAISNATVATSIPRASYSDMQAALTGIQTSRGTLAYTSAEVETAAKINYYAITISVDVDGLLAACPNSAGQNYGLNQTNPFVTMTDNHPQQGLGEGTNELQSEGLIPNMTVHWTATDTSTGDHSIQLLNFQSDPGQLAIWEELASIPASVPAHPNQKVCRVLATLPANKRAQYSFYFSVDGGPATYLFDPFMGDTKD
jgi:hypothetical protein